MNRVCVNGQLISEKTIVRNGYRVLIGQDHFFRANCPKSNDGALL